MDRCGAEAELRRVARLHGWTRRPCNRLNYYTDWFTRPESDGGLSVVRIRITHRVVDVQVVVGGTERRMAFPPLREVEQIMAGR